MSNQENCSSCEGVNAAHVLPGESRIQAYYKNKSVFITGATGFLGKVLIEKLLRSCTDLKAIYVLVRSKKGKTASERLIDIVNSHGVSSFRLILNFEYLFSISFISFQSYLIE